MQAFYCAEAEAARDLHPLRARGRREPVGRRRAARFGSTFRSRSPVARTSRAPQADVDAATGQVTVTATCTLPTGARGRCSAIGARVPPDPLVRGSPAERAGAPASPTPAATASPIRTDRRSWRRRLDHGRHLRLRQCPRARGARHRIQPRPADDHRRLGKAYQHEHRRRAGAWATGRRSPPLPVLSNAAGHRRHRQDPVEPSRR